MPANTDFTLISKLLSRLPTPRKAAHPVRLSLLNPREDGGGVRKESSAARRSLRDEGVRWLTGRSGELARTSRTTICKPPPREILKAFKASQSETF